MEEHIDGMEGAGIVHGCAEEGYVGHVGYPKKRHVHCGVGWTREKGSTEAPKRQSLMDKIVADDVSGIIEAHKTIAD